MQAVNTLQDTIGQGCCAHKTYLCARHMMQDMDAFLIGKGIDPAKYSTTVTAPEKTRHMAPGTKTGNGYVRHMSVKQKNFLLFLIKTRVTTNLVILPNQTIDPAKIETMGLPAAKALIEKLLACPEKPTASIPVMEQGTDKQQNYIKSMMAELNSYGLNVAESDINKYPNVRRAIDSLKELVAVARQNNYQKKESAKPVEESVTEGMYRVDNGDIYKVQKSRQSGFLYASKLEKLDTSEFDKRGNEITHKFEYMGKAPLRFIKAEHRMTMEEAAQFGKETGSCCNCGRTLTKQESIDRGIGPICAGKF